jgi:hypothetical protein
MAKYEPTHPSLYEKDKLAFDTSVVKGLNDRQLAYVLGLGRYATEREAAEAAGYVNIPPMTEKMREAVSAVWGKRIMAPNEILGRLSVIARSNINDYIRPQEIGGKTWGYQLEIPADKGHAIKSVSIDQKTGNISKIDFESKLTALTELAKLQNLYPREPRPVADPPQPLPMEINFIDASTKIDYRAHVGPPPDGSMVNPYPPLQEQEGEGGEALGENGSR